MTVKELYVKLSEVIPESLREEWDNDGIMCSSDTSADVDKILIVLDVTESVVDYAISEGFDLIISHHPLIFKPVSSLTEDGHIGRKLIKLISNNITVFSFHTRADKVAGGVNDILASLIGLDKVEPFGEGGMGRVGELPSKRSLESFAANLKFLIGADSVRLTDAFNPVHRVAVLGGDGKDFVKAAMEAGADTYISGRISYNVMEEGSEMGINLIEAGHYFTEFPVTQFFSELLASFLPNAYIEIADSNMIKTI